MSRPGAARLELWFLRIYAGCADRLRHTVRNIYMASNNLQYKFTLLRAAVYIAKSVGSHRTSNNSALMANALLQGYP